MIFSHKKKTFLKNFATLFFIVYEMDAMEVKLLSRRKFLLDVEIQANLTSIAFTSDAPAVRSVKFAITFTFLRHEKVHEHHMMNKPHTGHSNILSLSAFI